MTAADFTALHQRLGISRAEFCRKIGIAPNSGTAYALGRKPISYTVALPWRLASSRLGDAGGL